MYAEDKADLGSCAAMGVVVPHEARAKGGKRVPEMVSLSHGNVVAQLPDEAPDLMTESVARLDTPVAMLDFNGSWIERLVLRFVFFLLHVLFSYERLITSL